MLVIVRPSIGLNTDEQRIVRGIDITEKVLQGTVAAIAPGVKDKSPELLVGDEVLFRRPEGPLPELAFMSVSLILARLEVPKYD